MSPRRQLEEQDWAWSFPRPSHPLPASLLGNKGASGSWAHLVPGSTPTPALLMWNRVWALPGYCLRWGRRSVGRIKWGQSEPLLLAKVDNLGVRRVVSSSLREGHPRLRELSRRERGPGAESLQPSQARRSAPRSRGNLGAVGITSFRAKQQRRKDARVLKILPRGAGRRRGAAGRGTDYAHEVDFDWGAEALEPLSTAGRLAERTLRERVRVETPQLHRPLEPWLGHYGPAPRGAAQRGAPGSLLT